MSDLREFPMAQAEAQEHAQLPWRDEVHPDNGVAYIRPANDDEWWGLAQPIYDDRFGIAFIVRACNSHQQLVDALTCFVDRYVALVNSGDCGNWNAEHDVEVVRARAALSAARKG